MERLYIHRVEPVRKNGSVKLEPLPENQQQYNLGVKYRLSITKADDNNATCYGWGTGYSGGGSDDTSSPEAYVHVPKGFKKGNLAFVTAIDSLMGISTRDISSIEKFLVALDKSEVEEVIKQLQGFSFVGLIE